MLNQAEGRLKGRSWPACTQGLDEAESCVVGVLLDLIKPSSRDHRKSVGGGPVPAPSRTRPDFCERRHQFWPEWRLMSGANDGQFAASTFRADMCLLLLSCHADATSETYPSTKSFERRLVSKILDRYLCGAITNIASGRPWSFSSKASLESYTRLLRTLIPHAVFYFCIQDLDVQRHLVSLSVLLR
jgi:hypothetical protein